MADRVMYEVIRPGTSGFEADVLKFTDDFEEAKKVPGEIWKITYEGQGWKQWKTELIFKPNEQLTLDIK